MAVESPDPVVRGPLAANNPNVQWSAPASRGSWWFALVIRLTMKPLIVVSIAICGLLVRLGPDGIELWTVWTWLTDLNDRLAGLAPVPKGTSVQQTRLSDCRAEYVRAGGVPTGETAVLYFHGGGYVACGIGAYRRFAVALSRATGATVLNVNYRLLPRFPITHAVADGVDAYRRLLLDGYSPDHIVLGGDSAGGGLTFLVAYALKAAGLPRPAGLIGLSPWTDLDASEKLAHASARTDPMIPIHTTKWIVETLVSKGAALDLNLSPVNLDLRGLPPTVIFVGTTEVLTLDAVKLAHALAAADVPVTLKHWHGQVHVFPVAALGVLPQAGQALRELGEFVRERTGTPLR